MKNIKLGQGTCFSALLYFTFLAPTFPNHLGGFGDLKYFGFIFLQFACVVLFFIHVSVVRRYPNRSTVEVALGASLIFVLLTTISLFLQSEEILLRDLFEYYRPISALLFFLAAFAIPWSNNNIEEYASKALRRIIVFQICLSLIMVYSDFGYAIGTTLYLEDRRMFRLRALGTLGQTYYFGTFMLLSVLYFLFRLIYLSRKKLSLILLGLSFFMLLLSQSRTCLVALCCSLFYLGLLYLLIHRMPQRALTICGFIFVGIVTPFFFPDLMSWFSRYYPYAYEGIYRVLTEGVVLESSRSEALRVQQIIQAWSSQEIFPLWGIGISKASGIWLESFYAFFLFRFGLIGVLTWVLIFFWYWRATFRCALFALRNKHHGTAAFFMALHVFLAVLPIVQFSNAISEVPRLSVVYYGFLGITAGYTVYYRRLQTKQAVFSMITPIRSALPVF